jgi:hypothetical protein
MPSNRLELCCTDISAGTKSVHATIPLTPCAAALIRDPSVIRLLTAKEIPQ